MKVKSQIESRVIAAKRLRDKAEHIAECEADIRVAMVMAHQDGLSLRSIADSVGKSPETCQIMIDVEQRRASQ